MDRSPEVVHKKSNGGKDTRYLCKQRYREAEKTFIIFYYQYFLTYRYANNVNHREYHQGVVRPKTHHDFHAKAILMVFSVIWGLFEIPCKKKQNNWYGTLIIFYNIKTLAEEIQPVVMIQWNDFENRKFTFNCIFCIFCAI